MENQTGFDLNRALLAWKAELASEPGVSVENVRELQAHLLENISALQRRGLNDQEAFLKARQQLGSMSKIGAEFAKDNPLRIWRDRVFWAAIVEFLWAVLNSAAGTPTMRLTQWVGESLGQWAGAATFSVLNLAPVFGLFLLLATGRIQIIYSRVSWLFVGRWRLGIAGLLLIVVANLQSFGRMISVPVYELWFLGFAMVMMPPEMLAAARMKVEGTTDWRNSIRLWRDRLFWIAATQLAIGTWNLVAAVGLTQYIHSLPESKRSSIPVFIICSLVWLIPMAVMGVALSRARLSRITRMLQSRSGVLSVGLVLLLVGSCVALWAYHYAWPAWSTAQGVKAHFLYTAMAGFITEAGLIAAMLWLLRPQQRMSAGEAA